MKRTAAAGAAGKHSAELSDHSRDKSRAAPQGSVTFHFVIMGALVYLFCLFFIIYSRGWIFFFGVCGGDGGSDAFYSPHSTRTSHRGSGVEALQ